MIAAHAIPFCPNEKRVKSTSTNGRQQAKVGPRPFSALTPAARLGRRGTDHCAYRGARRCLPVNQSDARMAVACDQTACQCPCFNSYESLCQHWMEVRWSSADPSSSVA